MDCSKTNKRGSAIDIAPVVVGVCDVELTEILVFVTIGVANKRALPLSIC
jgi:hypothetical protein